MRQRSRWVGIGAAVLGLTLALAPLTVASAKGTKTKGSAPNSAMCKTVKNEQSGSTAASGAIEKAMTSGNFAAAKQAMLNSFNVDFNQVQKALSVVKTAPPKVQAAFKDLLSYVKQAADGDPELHQRDEPSGILRDLGQEPEAGE